MKTKSKLDQLKLVMQQKKERREARKLKCSPYNMPHSPHLNISAMSNAQPVSVPLLSANNSINNANGSHNRSPINSSGEAPLTATISSENHLEEVETVA